MKIEFEKEGFLKSLAEVGKAAGLDEGSNIKEIAEYISTCIEEFGITHDDGTKTMLIMLGIKPE